MLLIHPPVSRNTEPPLGIARLAGLLKRHGIPVRCVDLCAEASDALLTAAATSAAAGADAEASAGTAASEAEGSDRGTVLARRRCARDRALLGSPAGYENFDRYGRAVLNLNRVLASSSRSSSTPTLADYKDECLSPLRRADLLESAAEFELNVFYPYFSARLEDFLDTEEADVVGLSVNFLSQALTAFAIIGFIRRRRPACRVVLGGSLITSWTAQGRIARDERFEGLVDAVLSGRGEDTLIDYLGAERRWASATPDFEAFSFADYLSPVRVVPYNFASGCPWKRCTFCPEKAEDARYVALSPEVARAEIDELARLWDPGLIHFTDNELSPRILRFLAEGPPLPSWYGFARFSIDLADVDFCRRLAASGCRMLQLGLESGSQAVLDALGKGTRIEEIARVLAALRAANIGTYIYVLFGTPAENRASALVTRDFVALHADEIDYLNVAIFNMPAVSEEAALFRTRAFYAGDLSLYREFEHPAGWNRDTVRTFLSKDFEAEPAIRSILKRNPPVFTSNHAPFFLGTANS